MNNMYPDVITRNPLGGKCSHDCKYCYVKKWPINLSNKYKGKYFIDKNELNRIKESNKVIFICSCNDLFADAVPREFILRILERCRQFQSNIYLFQSKNPARFGDFIGFFPRLMILGTTIETDVHDMDISKAPPPIFRYTEMMKLRMFSLMVSIEPIMDFDVDTMRIWIQEIKPKYVSIGADSKGNKLSEPSPEKVRELIKELRKITEVRIKDNLKRMIKC